ncbi:hypothetical protein SELMODRAFT_425163 [Selaginella moellendorffii]|uniref:Protein kinase domain-containing protein n=1 Tax=Selaginella moellendorffii TaxID=88036 RepID=D8SS76_SELML|nr:hypothetical protein SELMODRAFT_425163 [Selaginella moellendorffii]
MQTRERSESSYGFLCNIKSLYLKRDEQVHFSPIKEIMRQLLVGLASLPERDLVDQDVQPACIRHSNFLVKLGDFQSARGLSTPPKPEVTGSLGYRALEVISGEAEKMVWGAGVVFALMLLGENPFDLSWDKWRAIVQSQDIEDVIKEGKVNDSSYVHPYTQLAFGFMICLCRSMRWQCTVRLMMQQRVMKNEKISCKLRLRTSLRVSVHIIGQSDQPGIIFLFPPVFLLVDVFVLQSPRSGEGQHPVRKLQ